MASEEIIREVYKVLEERRDNPIDSYTSKIMQEGIQQFGVDGMFADYHKLRQRNERWERGINLDIDGASLPFGVCGIHGGVPSGPRGEYADVPPFFALLDR